MIEPGLGWSGGSSGEHFPGFLRSRVSRVLYPRMVMFAIPNINKNYIFSIFLFKQKELKLKQNCC